MFQIFVKEYSVLSEIFRRLFPFLSVIISVLLVCSSCSLTDSTVGHRYTKYYLDYFDTVSSVIGYADSRDSFDSVCEQIEEIMSFYDSILDIYEERDGISNMCTVNRNAGSSVSVCDELVDFVDYCISSYYVTEGYTNVAMGSVLRLWHDFRYGDGEIPSQSELEDASAHCDISNVITDLSAGAVMLADKDMSVDVGAVAKGYVSDVICSYLRDNGISGYIITIGGNVVSVGSRDDGLGWIVGIADPSDPEKQILNVSCSDTSVVTSGSYERYRDYDGVRYHHIIDPFTLYPSDSFSSVTVISSSSALADVLSTALFSMPFEEGYSLVDSLEGTEAMWIDCDGSVRMTAGFGGFVHE